jgi:hypothetical protein
MMLPKQAPAVSRKINRFAAVQLTGGIRIADIADTLRQLGAAAGTSFTVT